MVSKVSNLKLSLIATLCLSASTVNAFQFESSKTIPLESTRLHALEAHLKQPTATIMRVKLTPDEAKAIAERSINPAATSANLPDHVNLGMNNVPVLDQGRHGSCVTFAVSAAIDAVLGKGDYVSQLCSLELGTHFQQNGYTYSGWDGSYGPLVLQQMMLFGVVNKSKEQNAGCAGVYHYPLDDEKNTGNELSLSMYKPLSENLSYQLYWKHLYSNDQLFDWSTGSKSEMSKVLTNVKHELAAGHRLTFGTFLVIGPDCSVGACASYHVKNDTWALTKGYDRPPYEVGGHEMVIYGYDDNAIALEPNGKQHKGLLFLRNSWGEEAGDQGTYYMTYQYFLKYANEVQAIIPLTKSAT